MFETDFLIPDEASKTQFLRLVSDAAQIVCQFLPTQPYVGKSPAELRNLISSDFLSKDGHPWPLIAETLQKVVANSVFVGHSHTAAHLHCPPLLASVTAEVVISALNQSMDSFDQAPIATIVEQKMIQWLCSELGFPSSADGTFTTGGSQSNYMGLLLARDVFLQKLWNWSAQKSGLPAEARRLRILCSGVAHFTVEKSASQLGLGTDAVMRIEVDDHFRMKPAALSNALEQLRSQELLPMAIVATAGTTDFGSVDPLREIATIAREADSWLHVDAAYGGALLFSAQHRDTLAGIELADSVAIDFHKLFWQPIPCSVFLSRDIRHFDAIKLYSDYLNPELHEEEGIPNLVTTSLLTSRRFDALKLWISFQAVGRDQLAAMIDRTIVLAAHAATVIRRTPSMELICEPKLSTVVFRYRPVNSYEPDSFNARLRQKLFDDGTAVIGHTRVRDMQCLKFTCTNPTTRESQMEELIHVIAQAGQKMELTGDLPAGR